MDWPDVLSPALRISSDDDSFTYNEKTDFTCQVIWDTGPPGAQRPDHSPTNEGQRCRILRDGGDWDEWLSALCEGNLWKEQSGYHVLLSARVRPLQRDPEIAAALTSLPFCLRRWQQVTQHFHLHSVICKAIKKDKNCSTFLIDKNGPEPEQAELYTALMSSEWPDNIAISSTHFPQSKMTLAVIYGCNPKQMERVKLLLASSPGVKGNSMLMGGVFAELQRERLEGLVLETENQLDKLVFRLGFNNVPLRIQDLDQRLRRQFQSLRLRAMRIEEEARSTHGELLKLMSRSGSTVDLMHNPTAYENSPEIFRNRLLEICAEVESMKARCRICLAEANFTWDDLCQPRASEVPDDSPGRAGSEQGVPQAEYDRYQNWFKSYLASVFAIAVLGGQITFTLIVSQLGDPSERSIFSIKQVRYMISSAWLLFTGTLGVAVLTSLLLTGEYPVAHAPRITRAFGIILTCLLNFLPISAFFLLALVAVAYTPVVGWLGVAGMSLFMMLVGYYWLVGW